MYLCDFLVVILVISSYTFSSVKFSICELFVLFHYSFVNSELSVSCLFLCTNHKVAICFYGASFLLPSSLSPSSSFPSPAPFLSLYFLLPVLFSLILKLWISLSFDEHNFRIFQIIKTINICLYNFSILLALK